MTITYMANKNEATAIESIESTFDSAAHDLIEELSGDDRNKAYDLYWELAGLIQDKLKEKYPNHEFKNF